MKFLLIFIGGGAGSILRYLFSVWFVFLPGKTFPWPTFLANIVSCLILGLAFKKLNSFFPYEPQTIWLLITGFCGGFSTFSTFSFEILTLLREGLFFPAVLYALTSLLVGVGCVFIGYMV